VHRYVFLWPPTPAIVFARDVLVVGTVPSATAHVYLLIEVAMLGGAGWFVYRRYAPRAAEYL
jgi:ABC-type polysaccharide/polyol phosphate export permease